MTVVDLETIAGIVIEITEDEVKVVGSAAVGPPGPQGLPGEQGPPGTNAGKRWYGIGPPGTIIGSQPNDEYVDVLTGDLYALL